MDNQEVKAKGSGKWQMFVLLAVIFLSGAVIGAGVSAMFVKNHHDGMHFSGPHQAAEHSMHRLRRALRLDSNQEREIEPIVEDLHRDLAELRREVGPQVRARIGRALEGVRGHLRDPQKQDLERYWMKMQERFGPGPQAGPREHKGDLRPRRQHRDSAAEGQAPARGEHLREHRRWWEQREQDSVSENAPEADASAYDGE